MKLIALAAVSAAFVCAQAPRALPLTDLPADTVVARSDGKPITAGEIRSLLSSGDPSAVNLAKTDPERFLGSVFVMRFLASEAAKNHLADQSPLKEEIQYIVDRIVANAMINRIRENYQVPEADVNAFYTRNSSRYEQAFIKAITVGFCPTIVPKTGTTDAEIAAAAKAAFDAANCQSKHSEDEARAIAAKIVARARAGEDFAKLVKEFSEDEMSKDSGGDYPVVTATSSYKEEIKKAVFALKEGEVSDPVRSGNYLYILKMRERTVLPLNSVMEQIMQELKQKHFTDWMQEVAIRFKPVIEHPEFFVKPPEQQKPAGPEKSVPQP